jgi:hypothetical protein
MTRISEGGAGTPGGGALVIVSAPQLVVAEPAAESATLPV